MACSFGANGPSCFWQSFLLFRGCIYLPHIQGRTWLSSSLKASADVSSWLLTFYYFYNLSSYRADQVGDFTNWVLLEVFLRFIFLLHLIDVKIVLRSRGGARRDLFRISDWQATFIISIGLLRLDAGYDLYILGLQLLHPLQKTSRLIFFNCFLTAKTYERATFVWYALVLTSWSVLGNSKLNFGMLPSSKSSKC